MISADGIGKMIELRARDVAAASHRLSESDRAKLVRRSLGLDPLPALTPLNVEVTDVVAGDQYHIEKLRFESRPGIMVTAHLYVPEKPGRYPAILRTHGNWPGKKSEPLVQAGAIGLVRSGYAVLVLDAPGFGPGDTEANERRSLGDRNDPTLQRGLPWLGVYVWDLMRALDYLETRPEVNIGLVGATGEGKGGYAVALAFALDPRIKAVVPVSALASLEVAAPQESSLCPPGMLRLGDWAEALTHRAKDGAVMLLTAKDEGSSEISGYRKTDEKLKRHFREAGSYRYEAFDYGFDYNRRMREAALAFFDQHLKGRDAANYVPEPIPLTDGALNPTPANTLDRDDPSLSVLHGNMSEGLDFLGLLDRELAMSECEPLDASGRLVPWTKYGKLTDLQPGSILAFHDEGFEPKEPGSIPLPTEVVGLNSLCLLGLSWFEVVAQVLHLSLPGGPSPWEEHVLRGDGLTSLVASMRTLVNQAPSVPAPRMCVALGPMSCRVAHVLKRYRPDLSLELSGQDDAVAVAWSLLMPNERYVAL